MHWPVYVDMSRHFTDKEQAAVVAALDALVPGTTCIGINRIGIEEISFTVEAPSAALAREAAAHAINSMLAKVQLPLTFDIVLGRGR